jgi:hypothetical protein
MFQDEVKEKDVLQLALNGHLKLSVKFINGTKVKLGKIVQNEIEYRKKGSPKSHKEKHQPKHTSDCLDIGDGRFIRLDDKVFSVKGIYELSMLGNGRLAIESIYQELTDGPEITHADPAGVLVEGMFGGMYQLQENFDDIEETKGSSAQLRKIKEYIKNNKVGKDKAEELLKQYEIDRIKLFNKQIDPYNNNKQCRPSARLPHDSSLIVRAKALIDMQNHILQQESVKGEPLDKRKERSYLHIIGALLSCVTGTFKDENFSSETKLRDFISDKYSGFAGCASRTLAEKFAEAKKAIKGELD